MSDHPVVMQTAIDALDVRRLAEFYRVLLGASYRPGDEPPAEGPDDEDWLVLVDDAGHRVLAFAEVVTLARPTWPEAGVDQQMHLDLRVPTREALEQQRARAEELGATLLRDRTDDEAEPLYVLADPEGHPFCLLVSAG